MIFVYFCAAIGKEHWEPVLKLTVSTPVVTVGQANSRLKIGLKVGVFSKSKKDQPKHLGVRHGHSYPDVRVWLSQGQLEDVRAKRFVRTLIPEQPVLLPLLGWVTQHAELALCCYSPFLFTWLSKLFYC